MIRAKVIRTDEKAEQFGEVAFSGGFNISSEAAVESYFSEKALNCETVGAFRVEITCD